MRMLSMFLALSLLACSGLGTTEEPVVEAEPAGPCCSVDDVIQLTAEGVDKTVIIATLRTAGVDLALTADDITRMTAASVDAEVIDVLNGGPCVCEEPPPVAVAKAAGAPSEPVSINVTAKYGGGGTFELVNLSTTDYTGLKLVANGSYQYRLKRLPAGTSDSIRLSTFVSTSDGRALKGDMTSLFVSSDQGTWSKTF